MIKNIFRAILLNLVVFSSVIAQIDLTFEIDNPPTEVCDDKTVTFKMEENEDLPCEFTDVNWEISDYSNTFSWQASGKQFTFWPQYGTTLRKFKVRAKMTCTWDDDNGSQTRTFTDTDTIKIVHPDFFQLSVLGSVDCDANSFEFRLRDPSGTLDDSNLDNISWIIPSAWTVVSGAASSTLVVNTNGNAEGSRSVKVKYEAIATKLDPVSGFPTSKKCVESREIVAVFNVSSCRPTISYPPDAANHSSSHSANLTSFGNTSLLPNNYNFASGESHEIEEGFDFNAAQNSSLHIFIEECDCESEWHDPNLMGVSTVSINNPNVVANKKALSADAPTGNVRKVSVIGDSEVQIFPNPFKNELTIIHLPEGELVQIDVLNTTLKTVWTDQKITDENGELHVNFGDLNTGLYILKVRYEKQMSTFKLIKN